MIIAIDFDNTLCVGQLFPNIGSPRLWLIEKAIQWKLAGHKLIMWTCREDVFPGEPCVFPVGNHLSDAIEFCRSYGLEFDAINQSIDEMSNSGLKFSRKIFADVYIDDKSVGFDDHKEEFIYNQHTCTGDLL